MNLGRMSGAGKLLNMRCGYILTLNLGNVPYAVVRLV